MALVFDTGPLYASFDRRDGSHGVARSLIEDSREDLVIPAPVLIEVDQLLGMRGRPDLFSRVLQDVLAGNFLVEDLVLEDYERIREILERYADSRIGFVDAAVLAVVERLNEPKLATLDRRHFGVMRPRHVAALRLLPE